MLSGEASEVRSTQSARVSPRGRRARPGPAPPGRAASVATTHTTTSHARGRAGEGSSDGQHKMQECNVLR
jgi:hypothetical protein